MNSHTRKKEYVLISAVNVANNFISRAFEEEISISPLKLQKLVYLMYKKYLQETKGKELFSERFETWKHGPVVPSIYSEFSSYGENPIKTYGQDSQGNAYAVKEEGLFKECIDYVWNKYKQYSGWSLSDFTHQPGTAWSIAKEQKSNYLNDKDILNEQEF